jgi:hypothetical protein
VPDQSDADYGRSLFEMSLARTRPPPRSDEKEQSNRRDHDGCDFPPLPLPVIEPGSIICELVDESFYSHPSYPLILRQMDGRKGHIMLRYAERSFSPLLP